MFRVPDTRRRDLRVVYQLWFVDGAYEGQRTCDDLRALKVLVRMQIARRQRKVDAHENQQEVGPAPHSACGRCDGEGALWGMSVRDRRFLCRSL